MSKDFEILAPAGSMETFKAVIEAGADAIYVGGSRFGARAYADNFTEEELLEAIDYAHLKGVKVYLTINTLLKNTEIDQLYAYLLPYYKQGIDAVLVQDFGALIYIHRHFPDLPIHTSTQMTVTGIDGVEFLRQFGVTRVVMAREMSLEEMKEIHDKTGMELEAFVHGALCYSYSGQCLFSSILGGRSGNRGRCAQPCRLPYKIKGKENYILSLKDLCGIKHLADLKNAGVYSLKIEGRMKQSDYAAGVVSIYSRYAKSLDKVSKEDYDRLMDLGNRCGFTDAFYRVHNQSDMVTYIKPNYTTSNENFHQEIKDSYINKSSKIPVYGYFSFQKGQTASLMVNYKEYTYTREADIVQEAKSKPLSRQDIVDRLGKTGNTPFNFDYIEGQMDDNIFIPNGSLNRLKREALEGIKEEILSSYRRSSQQESPEFDSMLPEVSSRRIIVSVETKAQFDIADSFEGVTDIYVDSSMLGQEDFISEFQALLAKTSKDIYLVLPAIMRKDASDFFNKISEELKKLSFKGFVAKNYESIGYVLNNFKGQKSLIADHNLYSFNDYAVNNYLACGLDGITMPLELNQKEIIHRQNQGSQMIVYAYYPLMTSASCVHKNTAGCDKKSCLTAMEDRYNKTFKVKNYCSYCYNVVYNSLPTVLFNEVDKLEKYNINSFRIQFSIESPEESKKVLQAFFSGNSIGIESTKGHFKRGVE